MKKKLVIFILILILISGGCYYYNKNSGKNDEIKNVVIEKTKIGNIKKSIKSEGTVEIKNEVDIFISRAQRVNKVLVEEGDIVKKGDVLITFDKQEINDIKRKIEKTKIDIENEKLNLKEYEFIVSDIDIKNKLREIESAQVDIDRYNGNQKILEIELSKLNLELENKEYDYNVKKELFEIEAISITEKNSSEEAKTGIAKDIENKKWEIEKNRIDIDEKMKQLELYEKQYNELVKKNKESNISRENNILKSKNKIKLLELDIDTLEDDLRNTFEQVLSPVDGTVIEVYAENNFRVNLEKSLMTVADINSQLIKADISSYEIKDIRVGQEVTITSEALEKDKKIKGIIKKISSIAKSETGSGYKDVVVGIEIEYDANNSGLIPGYEVDINILIEEKKDIISIPLFSIIEEKKKKFVYIVNKDNTVIKKEIESGMSNDSKTEVIGLNEGENVIINTNGISEGEKVKIVDKIVSKVKSSNKNEQRGGGGR